MTANRQFFKSFFSEYYAIHKKVVVKVLTQSSKMGCLCRLEIPKWDLVAVMEQFFCKNKVCGKTLRLPKVKNLHRQTYDLVQSAS